MSDIAKLKTQQHRLPSINRSKYRRRAGLEGPFMTKAGQVIYYDHKKGQYLDPDKDMYLSYDDWKKLSESRIMGLNRKSVEYKNGRAAAEKGKKYDDNPHAPGVKRLNWSSGHNEFRADALRKAGKPNYGARGQFEDYEEGFKSDAQRRAAFASGYKEKGKKKDEAIKGNDFVGVSSSSTEYKQGKQAAKDGKKKDDNPYKSGNREMNIKRMNWSSGHSNFREELDDKDKETIKPIIKQLQKSVKAHDKQAKQLQKDIKDEVELDEAVSAVQVNQISRMTDRNDHFGARIELARIAGDKELMRYYDSLEKMHKKLGSVIGNSAIEVRQKLEAVLKSQLQRRFGDKDAKRFMDAL